MADDITQRNKSKHYYNLVSKLAYLFGAPNYYYEEIDLPKFVVTIHDTLSRFVDITLYIFFASQWTAFFTQKNLNEKQKGDLNLFAIAQPIVYSFGPIVAFHKEKVKDLSFTLAIKLKEHYNDFDIETRMVKQAKFYFFFYSVFMFSAVILYGIDGITQVFASDKTFVTIVTGWPDIDDKTQIAGITRVLIYIFWWVYLIRMTSGYIVVVPLTICLSHQYMNLCSYFYSLNNIFDEMISHEEKERKYEDAVKLGISLHSETLRCTRLIQAICDIVYGAQIIVNIFGLIMLLTQMLNPMRTPTKMLTIALTAVCMLTVTGCLMWSAGDITVKASFLATAMFHSGWKHCEGQTLRRVRSLLIISMCQSQKPVELKCLGVIKLSYEWYLRIVRTSYSIFSVLY